MPLPPHHKLGRFELHSLIGAGGMGEVYRARDTRLGRDVAIKVLTAGLAADAEALQRFEQEARTIAALTHPNIITIFDVGAEASANYLVTELLDGQTLRDRLLTGPMPPAAALETAIQITRALAAAHAAGIVHRDLKPQNVFITKSGVAKLLDFGVSRLVEKPHPAPNQDTANTRLPIPETRQSVIVGTPAYMSPEQARGQGVDTRSDIFACGCVLYEMLAGKPPFARATPMDSLAAILSESPVPLSLGPSLPPVLERTLAKCLKKDAADRFQSASDLLFVLEAARDETFVAPGAPTISPKRSWSSLLWTTAAVMTVLGAGAWLLSRGAAPPRDAAAIHATTIVPASARPITAAISPDGQWVAYVGVAEGRPDLYVQFLTGGVPVNLTRATQLPVQNRTIVGGLDLLPDGSGIVVTGRPVASGLFRVPGVWIVPAPSGGPARRVTDRYASMKWSPDGRRVAAVITNPLVGDAVAVADVDGQNERILVPAGGSVHLHQVAWGHDGRHIYYARTLEPRHWSSDIYRVAVDGGEPEPIVSGAGIAMFPAPTPDGRALIYAGDHAGEGLNVWWRPFDGSRERRLTVGAGEYTEPFISRQGGHLVCLARRRKGELLRVGLDAPSQSAVTFGAAGSGDGDPSVAAGSVRIFMSSPRAGRRKIWSLDGSGQAPIPLTSGDFDDVRPAAAPDGRWVAFISNRGGRRGVWIVPSEGGTPRLLAQAEVIDYVSWSPDGKRLVYAAPAGTHGTAVWTVGIDGAMPTQIAGASGRTPAWSPVADVIATVRSADGQPLLHFMSAIGSAVREPLNIDPVGVPTALAWSPDGTQVALLALPGRSGAEVWIARLSDGNVRKVIEYAAPTEFDGVTWTRDGRALLVGRVEYETEVLLIRGLP